MSITAMSGAQSLSDLPVDAGGVGWCVWELTNLDRLSNQLDWYADDPIMIRMEDWQ